MTHPPGTPRTPGGPSESDRHVPKVRSPTSLIVGTPKSTNHRSKNIGQTSSRAKSKSRLQKNNTTDSAAADNYIRTQTSREIAELIALLRASRDMKVIEVEHSSSLTEDQFYEVIREGVPIIFRAYASEWKCVKDWPKPNYLRLAAEEEARELPHRKYRQFTAQTEESGRVHLTDGKSKAKIVSAEEFITKSDVCDNIVGQYLLGIHSVGHSSSLMYCPVQLHTEDRGRTPPLCRDVPRMVNLLDWYSKYLGEQTEAKNPITYDHQQFFLARGYAFTDLHYDSYDNFYVAASGTRRWTLACPNVSRWLIDSSAGKLKSGSQIVPHQGKFPPGSPAQIYPFSYVDLSPGDILYLPACWWHLVESIAGDGGYSSAFNFFFSKPPDEVYGEFTEELAKVDRVVNSLQPECRRILGKSFSSRKLGKIPASGLKVSPTRIPQSVWDQLLVLAADHELEADLERLYQSHMSNSISPRHFLNQSESPVHSADKSEAGSSELKENKPGVNTAGVARSTRRRRHACKAGNSME